MFITIFGSIGMLCFIVIAYKLFFSTSDEIPVSSKLPELPKTNKVYQPPKLEHSADTNSTANDQQYEEKRTRPAIFYENKESEPQAYAKEIPNKTRKKYSYTTTFQKLCERPNLISFDKFVAQTNFGFNRDAKTHYSICMLLYPFLMLFRLFLYIVSWIGTLFFNILIRFIFELIIRIIWFVIQIFFRALGSLLD